MAVSSADTASRAKAPSTPPADHALHGRALALVFFGLLLAMFISSLSETIASTALPTIVGDLNGVEIMQWVSTAYILSSTLVMPIYGKLGDLIGRKRLLMAALTLYAAGKVVCGLAVNIEMLISGRLISGLGGGGLIILSQATLSDVVPPRKLGTYMGVIGAVFAVSNVLGPLLGGWFVQVTGWRWIFWFTVPVALLAVVVLGLTLPRDARALGKHPIDWPGMMAMTVAVTSLVLALAWGGTLIPWGSLPFMGLVALAVAAAVVFVLLERRAAEPIIPMGLFRNRNFVLCSVTGLFLNISFMGALNYLPTYFQIVDDLSPEVAGLVCTATSVGILIISTATGWVASKTGRCKGMLVAMCVVSTVGLFLLSRMQVHEALWVPVLYLFVLGFGMGLGMQLLVLVVQNEFPHAMVGTATAANNFFRQIGASVGTALVGALFTMRLTADVAGKLTHVDNLSLATLTPQIVDKLPASAQSVIAAGYSDALLPLFLWFVPLMLACLVMMLLLKRHPLATTINHGGAGK
ncbi:DHA2 family efflux MFS transporter permease subunit [Adlercreutzia equolifaciens]|uniref:DHA2 family efflux MFS transporter permease subunit n=1 Tax=Adlercreutzia equolifaciens TaxID=446660 RepID=UPI003A8D1728